MINEHILETVTGSHYYSFKEKDYEAIHKIKEEIFDNWDWNYGKSPKFTGQACKKFPGGTVTIAFNVKKGIIDNCSFTGDFFSKKDVKNLEDLFKTCPYESDAIQAVFNQVHIEDYFMNISSQDLTELFVKGV